MGTNVKRLFKKCPFLLLLTGTGILFSLIGLWGHKNIYAGQEYDPLREPALVMMFQGLKEDIYPWQILEQESAPVMAQKEEPGPGTEKEEESAGADTVSGGGIRESEGQGSGSGKEPAKEEQKEEPEQEEAPVQKTPSPQGDEEEENPPKEEEEQEEEELPKGRIEPLRESTREEYLNHISADIYGDVGVRRAAEYEFTQVDESYFDDALFIGDSRTIGMQQSQLLPASCYYAKTGIGIGDILSERIVNEGGYMTSVADALSRHSFGKVYIMIGINDISRGDVDWFLEQYQKILDTVARTQPNAIVYIQANIPMSYGKQDLNGTLNNRNLALRNEASSTLADSKTVFYLDISQVYADAYGNLASLYTRDGLHVKPDHYALWVDYLLHHAIVCD